MSDTTQVQSAICQLINAINQEDQISNLEELKTGLSFISMLLKLDKDFFSDLQVQSVATGLEEIDNCVLRWTQICEYLDMFVKNQDSTGDHSEISSGIDVVLISEGNQSELINLIFIFITLLVNYKYKLWEDTIKSIPDESSMKLLVQIKNNLTEDLKSNGTESPRKQSSGHFNSANVNFLKRSGSTEGNYELIERVEKLEELLLQAKEESDDQKFKIKQQDNDLRDMELVLHQKQMELEYIKTQMESLQHAQHNDMVLYGTRYIQR